MLSPTVCGIETSNDDCTVDLEQNHSLESDGREPLQAVILLKIHCTINNPTQLLSLTNI